MKRLLALLICLMLALPGMALAEAAEAPEIRDALADQAMVDAMLLAEAEAGYTLEEPLVVVNPYGNAPLSAVAIFTTEEEVGGQVTAKGHAPEDDITGAFEAAQTHFVPIYGLYAGGVTEVEIALDDGRSNTLEIETEYPNILYGDFSAEMHEAELYTANCLNVCCLLSGSVIAGFDSKAELRWFYINTGVDGIRIADNGHMLIPCGLQDSAAAMGSSMLGVDEVDFMGKIYRRYIWAGGVHHDFMQMPGGNLLALADTPGKPGSMDYIVEIDRETGAPVWELALSDLVRTDDSGAVKNSAMDWSHANGVCYDEASDTLIVSCRNQDAIFGIRKADHKLLWLLGDPTGWEDVDASMFFTPVGDDFEWQYGAHNVSLLDNGDLLLFDNGLGGRVKLPDADKALPDEENYSRAVIYRLDVEHMTAEQVWEYGKELGATYFASIMSGATPLNGSGSKMLVDFGTCKADESAAGGGYGGNITRLCLLDEDRLVWQMQYSGGPTYRAFRIAPYDLAPWDVQAAGVWLGDLGETAQIPAAEAEQSADALPGEAAIERYPFNAIHVTGALAWDESEPQLSLALKSEDGQAAFALNFTKSESESGVTLNLNKWISLNGIPAGEYGVFMVANGAEYDLGEMLTID